MAVAEDLEQLAETCLQTAKVVKSYLALNGLPQPTFDQHGPSFFPKMSQEVELARLQLQHASKTLYDLASGPAEYVGNHPFNCIQDLNAYRYASRFNIASFLKQNETISYTELAIRSKTDERQLRKVIRQLIQVHVFCEPRPGHVSHTAASSLLNHDGLSAYNAYHIFDNLPLVMRQITAIEKWGHGSEEPYETPSNIYYGNSKSCYENYPNNPDTLSRFSRLMKYVSGWDVFSMQHCKAGYDWASLGNATIVDIGGSMGHCSAALAEVNSQAKFIVQDLPEVVAKASDPAFSLIPDAVQHQISFVENDFFTAQPVDGADVYFMRMVMHDFSDKYCIKILREIVRAMRSNSRIIIMDQIVPPHGTLPSPLERMSRTQDLLMMLLTNATEREFPEWKRLLAEADARLRIKSVAQPPGSLHAVIEVVLDSAA